MSRRQVDLSCPPIISSRISLELPASIATSEGDIEAGWYGMDIGPFAAESFCKTIARAGTIIWNGPLGKIEDEPFRVGTELIAKAIAESSAISLIGGGETTATIENLGLADRMTHVSFGDEAFVAYLQSGTLPGLSLINGQTRDVGIVGESVSR